MSADDVNIQASAGDYVTRSNSRPDVYKMRALWSVGPAYITWTHTSIDTTGDFSGKPLIELSDIRLLKKVLNVTPDTV